MVFKSLCVLVLWRKVASAVKGLIFTNLNIEHFTSQPAVQTTAMITTKNYIFLHIPSIKNCSFRDNNIITGKS